MKIETAGYEIDDDDVEEAEEMEEENTEIFTEVSFSVRLMSANEKDLGHPID